MNCLKSLFRRNSAPVIPGADFAAEMRYSYAIRMAYRRMPETFYASAYLNEVRRLSGTRAFDSTILRALRKLRQKNPQFVWICIDNKQAIYKKINQN